MNVLSNSPYAHDNDFSNAVTRLNDSDFTPVIDFMVRLGHADREEAEAAAEEFKKFASLFHLSDEALVAPKQADEFWHTFLLFTTDYKSWCREHFGDDRFLNHFPGRATAEGWSRTRELGAEVYGEQWTRPATSSGSFAECLNRGNIW